MSKKIKVFAIIILIIAAIVYASTFFDRGNADTPTSPLNSSSKGAGISSNTVQKPSDFSVLLSTIKSIEIDTSIFNNSAYQTLRDYPVILGSDIVGRSNPFAPVGVDEPIGVSNQIQFETLQPAKVTSTTAEFGAQALLSNTNQANVIFEFGTTTLLGSATSPVSLTKNGTVLYTALGLSANTKYYVRAVLSQGGNTTVGDTMTFNTLAPRN